MKYIIAGLMFLVSTVQADTLLVVEGPAKGSTNQGVGTIRGWALADDPIVVLRMSIDGAEWQRLPRGGTRYDIDDVWGDIFPDALTSGFSATFNWGKLDPGVEHSITVQILTSGGGVDEQTNYFYVSRLNPSDKWKKSIDMQFTFYGGTDTGFTIENALIGDTLYDSITFEWSNVTQKFEMVDIVELKF